MMVQVTASISALARASSAGAPSPSLQERDQEWIQRHAFRIGQIDGGVRQEAKGAGPIGRHDRKKIVFGIEGADGFGEEPYVQATNSKRDD